MSQHIVTQEEKKFVFGWDQPLMSFFLQVHDLTISEEDEDDRDPIVARFGASADTQMYEVEDLVRVAAKQGLLIGHPTRVELYGEKDDGV
jgi:hypothetical protein